MMIRWWEHSQKGVTDDGQTDRQTDGRTDRQTDWTIHRAAWSQLKSTSPHSLIEHIKFTAGFSWSCPDLMFPILHKVWHSLLSIMKHIKALIIDGSYSIWILTFCFGQPMWRSFCCATLHQKRHKWHTAMVMAIVDCDVTKLSVWLLCVTWPVSFYADRNSVDVDAPGERVWGVTGPSVWRVLLETRIFYPW